MDLTGKSVWVIGASSGIGAELAREVVRRGGRVAVSARDEQALRDVAGGSMVVAPLDVTDPESIASARQLVVDRHGRIDVAVISSGYWNRMSAQGFDAAEFRRHVDVNLTGMANCIADLIPVMRAQGGGMLVGIASVAGYRGMPGAEGYGPSKAGQINLLESLRAGLRRDGIRVQTVCPGFVRTPMTDTNDFPMPFLIEPDEAARSIADGIEKEKAEVVFPWEMALLMKAARLVPNALWPRLAAPRVTGEDAAA